MRIKLRSIYKLVKKNYIKGKDKKSRLTVFKDLLLWNIRHDRYNEFYFTYGFDNKSSTKKFMLNFYDYGEFRSIRDERNLFAVNRKQPKWKQFNYLILTRDKLLFNIICNHYQIPQPKVFFIYDSKEDQLLDIRSNRVELDEIDLIKSDMILKDKCGDSGNGCFFLYEDTQISKSEQFCKIKTQLTGYYLIQEKINQHSRISKLNPSSLNTLRLITVKQKNGTVVPILGMFRVGRSKSLVDNWAQGGVAIAVDIKNGQLKKYGHLKHNNKGGIEHHPDSKIKFESFQLPYFVEAVEYAKILHKNMDVHNMGWDIGFTESGPIFIEGGDDWEISHQQSRGVGLKEYVENQFKK